MPVDEQRDNVMSCSLVCSTLNASLASGLARALVGGAEVRGAQPVHVKLCTLQYALEKSEYK
jgi:hypothetical protein